MGRKYNPAKPRLGRCISLMLVGLLALQVAGCGNRFCPKDQVESEGDALVLYLSLYRDMITISAESSDFNLDQTIDSLTRVRDLAQNHRVPPCLFTAQGHLVQGMNEGVNALVIYKQTGDTTQSHDKFDESMRLIELFVGELTRIRACAPDCATPQATP